MVHHLATVAKPLSWALTGSGWVLLVIATSLGEHLDFVLIVSGGLLVALGFWLRDWKIKRESFETEMRGHMGRHDTQISGLMQRDRFLERVADELQGHMDDERHFQQYVIKCFALLAPGAGDPPEPAPRRKLHEPQADE